jgi:hypothetical protein
MSGTTCRYCGKVCASQYGLEQHLKASKYCQSLREIFVNIDKGLFPKQLSTKRPSEAGEEQNVAKIRLDDDRKPAALQDPSQVLADLDQENTSNHGNEGQDQLEADEEVFSEDDNDDMNLNDDQEQLHPLVAQGSTVAGEAFREYCEHSELNRIDFTLDEVTAIRIMQQLIKKRAPLDTYEAVMEWHLRACNKLYPQERLGEAKEYISREVLMKKLKERYNMDKQYAVPYKLLLPHSHTKVLVWRKHARDNVVSLLTDPRWKDEDWLYFDDDPFASPPETCAHLEDINTGEAYLATHKRLITKPNQILVAIPLYIDGAVTGQYDKLQVTALKMTIGLLNRRARDREHAWRSLGYVPNYTKSDSRGKRILAESGHVSSYDLHIDSSSDEDEGQNAAAESDVDKAADYHAILSVLLETLKELIEEGMVIDLFFKGKLYKNCELVFFIPFVKCDGDEGDKLCCSYRSRGQHVQQLCRYCQCPNAATDDHNANWPYKTEPLLKKLFEQNNAKKLKELSQICIQNAFHDLRFGLHNDRGIHGACPLEILHAVQLGIFKYTRDCFFAQIGPTSGASAEINALAGIIGAQFQHQSDRNKPRTKFGNGIQKGKLMAKEFTGVLLIMCAILKCKAGQRILRSAKKKNFKNNWQIQDWLMLVETLLQWEAFLMLPKMQKIHVRRLKKKHRFLMFLLKKIGNRVKGMGFKVMKVHAMIHLAYDILMFSVPMNVDTGSNESHHKRTKVAAKLTQKDIKTFEKQTSNRCDDFHVLDLAMEEIDGRPLWEYYDGFEHQNIVEKPTVQATGGMMMVMSRNQEYNDAEFKVITRMDNRTRLQVENGFVEYCTQIQEDLAHLKKTLPFCAEHSRGGQIFRAHPNYKGTGVWRDWVMIKWENGSLPAQIWGYIDLTFMATGTSVVLRNGKTVEKGVYAIIESANYVSNEDLGEDPITTDIFTEIVLETEQLSPGGEVLARRFYLVDVETFEKPIVVIPNIGAIPKCKFLLMTPKAEWSDRFIQFIMLPHADDEAQMAATDDEQEQVEQEEEEDGDTGEEDEDTDGD